MTSLISSLIIFSAFLFSGCLIGSEKSELTPLEDPILMHTGVNLVLSPYDVVEESLYVKNAKPGEWTVFLLSAPKGTFFQGGKITYSIPEGLDGNQEVHATATNGSGTVLDLKWTVMATPNVNLPPKIVFKNMPGWIVVGRLFRIAVEITDPEGDAFTVTTRLPPEASYHNGIIEWTPTAAQTQMYFSLEAVDSKKHSAVNTAFFNVYSFDPEEYAANLSVGRTWWIRGYQYNFTDSGDTTHLRRRVRITSSDPATGSFGFHTIDTVTSGGKDTITEGDFSAVSRNGVGFGAPSLHFHRMLPFYWPGEEPITDAAPFPAQENVFSTLRQIQPSTCLQMIRHPFGCEGHIYEFAPDLGRVYGREEGFTSTLIEYVITYEVWKIAGP